MLSKGDDYPIHQTPDPIAYAGSDRNFYDRYFFNGYARDGGLFFGAALGVYPALGIMDAAFGLRVGERQYNLHASRHLGHERMDTRVGPIAVEVIEPLRRLRVAVDDAEHRVFADIVFEGRFAPVEEPRSTRRHGARLVMDITRLTQFGSYSGWVEAGGQRVVLDGRGVEGVRDRSWGIRAVGERDPQAMVPPIAAQFHWTWLTAQFDDRAVLAYRNDDAAGAAWNAGGFVSHADGRVDHFAAADIDLAYHPGTRWPRAATVTLGEGAERVSVAVDPGPRFQMTGLGYLNPDWNHGVNKGPLATGYDEIDLAAIGGYAPPHIHTQAFSALTLTTAAGDTLAGRGTLEALSFGPHARLGFAGAHDAP